MAHLRTIMWNNRAQQNLETCSLLQTQTGFELIGAAVMEEDGLPMRANYRVMCTDSWQTREVELQIWKADHEVRLMLKVDDEQKWWRNGDELTEFAGLIDIDLGFTPATNTLPIRRLNLKQGQSHTTTAVWIQFPALNIVQLLQRYTRTGEQTYVYESLRSGFQANLTIDEHSLVTDYETLWQQVSATT